uniref:Coiled-coil domain-containing protein 22 n=1 Tax=Oncorhynchus mykiss TaxID=8022 RepID=A0A8C7Q9H0_ONCMY
MEEVDKILIHSLRQTGTDVGEDVQSVKRFSSELIVEAVVKCLRVIDPALGSSLSHSLPPGMSARFRVGMSLAQACQDLGYKGEIGYQTFLYSNEPEIRSLLMFLVEKLPRESAEALDQPAGKSVLLQKLIAAQIKAQLALPWLPPSCRLPLLCKTQVAMSCWQYHKALMTWQLKKRARLQKRIEEQLRTAAQSHSDTLGAHTASALTELLQSFGGSSLGGDILAKGTRFTHTEKFTFTQEPAKASQQMAASSLPSSHQSEEELQARQQEELASLQRQLQQLSLSLEEVGGDMRQLTTNLSPVCVQVSDELKQKELSKAEKEDSVWVKKQTIDLMPDAENNLAKLQALVEGSAKRVVNLAAQWEKRRAPLIDEHRRLKELCSNQESSRKLSEIKELHNKIHQSAEESKKKEALYKQLITEFENLPKDVSRSAYTARILEIVGNIRKQKEEITKILSDTKELQKEINNLTGKLDRTFAVTDELVFKDAKKDESVRKSYKYLAALHENCTQLIQTIEDTGTIMREIRDLEEQIETENGKKTVSNLEKILEDYKAIRQENSALAAKIREA